MRSNRARWAVLCAMVGISFLLCGCSPTQQPENQAYALSLTIDRTDQGLMEVGLLIPRIGTSPGSGKTEDENKSDGSMSYFVQANSFLEALDLLQSVAAHSVNLSQLKTIVVSFTIASEPTFDDLVNQLMLTNHLFGTPYVVVSQNGVKEFIQNVEPKVGSRLSSDLSTSLLHYHEQGYIPLVHLSDLYYAFNSIHGGGIAILGATNDKTATGITLPPGMLGDALPGTLPSDDPTENKFMGTVLMKDGHAAAVLNGAQTRWLMVLTGELNSFNYVCQGLPMRIGIKYLPKVSVDVSSDPVQISVGIDIMPIPQREMPDLVILDQQMRAEISDLLLKCQSLGVDPFHFGEYAARSFWTDAEFMSFDWNKRFEAATVHLDINVASIY